MKFTAAHIHGLPPVRKPAARLRARRWVPSERPARVSWGQTGSALHVDHRDHQPEPVDTGERNRRHKSSHENCSPKFKSEMDLGG